MRAIIVAGGVMVLASLPARAQVEAVRGVTRAVRDANIASELNARIRALPVREGEAFAAGDTLVVFDCDRAEAELLAAQAETALNRIGFETAQALDRRRAIGRAEVQSAKAKVDKAVAAAEALRIRVRECRITAPFSGRVVELRAHEHEMAGPGQPLLRIVDAGAIEIDLIVSSAWLAWLRAGTPFRARVDETGRTYAARVVRTAAAVDPVSQTIRITAAFSVDIGGDVLPGMSLEARFERPAS